MDGFSTERTLLWTFALTTTVSSGLAISLILRESASLNALNLVTLIGAPLSVLAAFYFSRNLVLLLMSYALFVITVAPATFGWVAFLYVPSFLLLMGVVIFTLISRAVTLIRRFFR